jgi:hypothetical protein
MVGARYGHPIASKRRVCTTAELLELSMFRLWLWAALVARSLCNSGFQRFEAVDHHTHDSYTSRWNDQHQSWIGINEDLSLCNSGTQTTVYPICVGSQTILESSVDGDIASESLCPRAICVTYADGDPTCSLTPSDTIDYLPPAAVSSLDNATICPVPASFAAGDPYVSSLAMGMDLGIEPLYLPIVPVRLNITGRVSAFNSGGQCVPIGDVEITAWQVNPTALIPYTLSEDKEHAVDSAAATAATKRGTPFSGTTNGGEVTDTPQTSMSAPQGRSLRGVSCRATQHSASDGSYRFLTLVPPSYGPPRHIMFQVSAPGYDTLTTRMYFDRDWRLQQLTTLGGRDAPETRATGSYSLPLALKLRSDAEYWAARFPSTPVARDPRVASLRFRSTTAVAKSGLVSGLFDANFNFVLRPTRSPLVEPTTAAAADGAGKQSLAAPAAARDVSGAPPVDLNGLWADSHGALMRVETHGPSFIAHEYPHARTWGTAMGVLLGDSIRAVDFHQVVTVQAAEDAEKQRSNPMVLPTASQ